MLTYSAVPRHTLIQRGLPFHACFDTTAGSRPRSLQLSVFVQSCMTSTYSYAHSMDNFRGTTRRSVRASTSLASSLCARGPS